MVWWPLRGCFQDVRQYWWLTSPSIIYPHTGKSNFSSLVSHFHGQFFIALDDIKCFITSCFGETWNLSLIENRVPLNPLINKFLQKKSLEVYHMFNLKKQSQTQLAITYPPEIKQSNWKSPNGKLIFPATNFHPVSRLCRQTLNLLV